VTATRSRAPTRCRLQREGERRSGYLAEPGFGMLVQEVTQRRNQLPSMWNIVAPNRRADVVHQHVFDLCSSVHALKQAAAQHGGDTIRDMLMLGNGLNLVRCECPTEKFTLDSNILRACGRGA
jgi:hypothetical protein